MKLNRQLLFVLVLVSFATASLPHAGETFSNVESGLSLPDAVALALKNSPSLNAEQARATGSRERQGAARAGYRPQASLDVNATQFQDPMIITPIHGFAAGDVPLFDDTLIQSSLNIQMLLYDGKARKAAVRQTKAQSGAAMNALNDARSRVIADTVVAYLNLRGSRTILEAQDLRLKALRLEQVRTQDLYSVGRIAEVEVLRMDAAVAQAEAERTFRATTLENAERDLARMLGLEVERISGESVSPQVLLEDKPLARDALLALARAGNTQIQQAEKRFEAAESGIAIARSSRKPKLSASASLINYGSAGFDSTTEWAAGLRLSIPLYTGGKSARKIAEAEAVRDEAEQELLALQRRIASSVDHALGAWKSALDRENSLGAAVRGFNAVAESEKLKLETGTGIPTDFLDAEADLLDARANRVIATNAVILSRVELAGILGELDEAWVVRSLAEAVLSRNSIATDSGDSTPTTINPIAVDRRSQTSLGGSHDCCLVGNDK